ncbi:MAG: binding-protein-dependent transport system inner rane component, partial [Alphaproteobacteria bacterium]|nr:binding-protein-dependent transport system inner rane component [Alphaproteobacteria bacterium]
MTLARRNLSGYAFVGPFLFLYLVILIWPLLFGITISFHRADLFGARVWVG